MFSANENILLREHKKRVVKYVEDTIPEHALDKGTSVMVMQTACRTPGCVPLETAIAIIFPRPVKGSTVTEEMISGVKESSFGGTFKTKVLLPLSEVTKDDILDALPPGFNGGRKTWERTCLNLRDMVLGRIGGLVGIGDDDTEVEDRRVLAEYLRQSLTDYLLRDCKAPNLGMPFDVIDNSSNIVKDLDFKGKVVQGSICGGDLIRDTNTPILICESKSDILDVGQIKQPIHHDSSVHYTSYERKETTNDWRRMQKISNDIEMKMSSNDMLSRLSEKQHAPGVRSPGCPCCDPENISKIVDQVMF